LRRKRNKMPKYLFNYQATVEVIARDEDEARELFWLQSEQGQYLTEGQSVDITDSDVMLVEVDGETPTESLDDPSWLLANYGEAQS
jgi:hypothetical protein